MSGEAIALGYNIGSLLGSVLIDSGKPLAILGTYGHRRNEVIRLAGFIDMPWRESIATIGQT